MNFNYIDVIRVLNLKHKLESHNPDGVHSPWKRKYKVVAPYMPLYVSYMPIHCEDPKL